MRYFNRRNVISEDGKIQLNNFAYNENEKKLFFDPETYEKERTSKTKRALHKNS
jgi:hypothetical protein